MASRQNTLMVGVQLVKAAPSIIKFIETLSRHSPETHTGAEKKEAAIEVGKQLLIGAGETALAANPNFSAQYGDVIQAAFDMAVAPSIDKPASSEPKVVIPPFPPEQK